MVGDGIARQQREDAGAVLMSAAASSRLPLAIGSFAAVTGMILTGMILTGMILRERGCRGGNEHECNERTA